MVPIEKQRKLLVLLLLLLSVSGISKAQLTTTYLSPTRIIGKEAKGDLQIINEECLLPEGTGQADLANKNSCLFKSSHTDTPYIILDFGKELHGGIQIVAGHISTGKPAKFRIRFGESVSETLVDIGEKGATNDHAIRDLVLEIPQWGKVEFGNTGFRFIRLDLIDSNTQIQINEIRAKSVYQDIPYLGSFHSNDELLNQIWMTGAYTVHLNLQDYLWDGIKRDRLVWIGDIHPEVATVNSVFGYNDAVPRSLDLARDNTPLPNWMNGHSSYSLWWIITHKDWFLHHGDINYLKEQKNYLIPLLRQLISMIDEDGKEQLNGVRFLDWPSSGNPQAVHAGLQALMIWALSDGKYLCSVLNEKETAFECEQAITRLQRYIPESNGSKQAGALLGLSGLIDSQKADEIITINGVQDFSTFYGYYMLQALAKAENYDAALESIRRYWGGMLSVGATTFWEDFDINWLENASPIDKIPQPGKVDIHAEYGDFCYKGLRHSLCHGWASGPTAWLSEHILGIKIIEPGCKTIQISPNLGDLQFAEGSYPTPMGILKVKHVRQSDGKIKSDIQAPKGVKIINHTQG
ncbi:MAG: alpha-L-rhamnosidase [Tannerellaceae bacterium]|nr:alpha-L-rhamnosidase [Tannerellaceae bacterium]